MPRIRFCISVGPLSLSKQPSLPARADFRHVEKGGTSNRRFKIVSVERLNAVALGDSVGTEVLHADFAPRRSTYFDARCLDSNKVRIAVPYSRSRLESRSVRRLRGARGHSLCAAGDTLCRGSQRRKRSPHRPGYAGALIAPRGDGHILVID